MTNATKTATHTPGPWTSIRSGPGWHIHDSESMGIVETLGRDGDGEEEANARLIAAAPTQHDELCALADDLQSFSDSDTVPDLDWITENLESIRAVIAVAAKAEGGAA